MPILKVNRHPTRLIGDDEVAVERYTETMKVLYAAARKRRQTQRIPKSDDCMVCATGRQRGSDYEGHE